jgi:hypothetical protein
MGSKSFKTLKRTAGQPVTAVPISNKIKVIAIGRFTEMGRNSPDKRYYMLKEAEVVLSFYMIGVIEQMYSKMDDTGLVFVMNVMTPEHAKEVLDLLPSKWFEIMKFEIIPLSPFSPLGLLTETQAFL